MYPDSHTTKMRNIVYEVVISMLTPSIIMLTFINLTNNQFQIPSGDDQSIVLLGGLLAFAFPTIRSAIWTVCVLINTMVIYVRIQVKCKTDWDCRSANDLFNRHFPFDPAHYPN